MFTTITLCVLLLAHRTVAQDTLSNALSGTKLRCCVVHEPPIVFIDPTNRKNNGTTGIIVDYLEEMQALLGWQCKSITEYVAGNGTSFNAFIEMMSSCTVNGSVRNDPQCQCDIGIAGWFPSAERVQLVDILPAFVFDGLSVSFSVATAYPSGESFFFLTTFDLKTWGCIFLLIVLFVLAKMMDRHFDSSPNDSLERDGCVSARSQSEGKEWSFDRIGKAVKSTVNRIMLQPSSEADRDGGGWNSWVLNLTLGVCGLFLVLSYEASVTASLVQENLNSEYQSVEDFQKCRIRPEDVCVPGGSSVETFWKTAIATDECHKGATYFRGTLDEVVEGAVNGTCRFGLLLDSTAWSAINGRYCGRLIKNEELIYTAGLGMVLPKGSPFTEPMSLATLVLRNEAAHTSLGEYFRRMSSCPVGTESGPQFAKFRIFFALAFAACGYFLLVSLIKRMRHRKRRRRGTKTGRIHLRSHYTEHMGFAY